MKFWTLTLFSILISLQSFALPDFADTHHFIEGVVQTSIKGHGFKLNTPGIDSFKALEMFNNKKYTPKGERGLLSKYLKSEVQIANDSFNVYEVEFTLSHMLSRRYHTRSLYLKTTILQSRGITRKNIKYFLDTTLKQRKHKQHALIKDHEDPSIIHLVYVAKDLSGEFDCHSASINDFFNNRTEQEDICDIKINAQPKGLNFIAKHKYKKRRSLIFNFTSEQKESFILNSLESTLTANGLSLIPETIELETQTVKGRFVDKIKYSYINRRGEQHKESLYFIAKKRDEKSTDLLNLRDQNQVAHVVREPSFYHSFNRSEFIFFLTSGSEESSLYKDVSYKDLIYSDISKQLFKPDFAEEDDYNIKDLKDMSN